MAWAFFAICRRDLKVQKTVFQQRRKKKKEEEMATKEGEMGFYWLQSWSLPVG